MTRARLTAPAVAGWLALLVLVIAILQKEAHVLPWSVFLPIVAGASALAMWRARAALRADQSVALAAFLFAGLLLGAAIPALTGEWPVNEFAMAGGLVVAGWTSCLLALAARPSWPLDKRAGPTDVTDVSRWPLAALLIGAFALLAAARWMMQIDHVTFFDEPLYVLQSRLMGEPGFVRPMDEALSPFFALRQTVFSGGRFYTQYPPGHPAILAAFDAVGLRVWTGVLLSTAGVLFTYLLGRDLFSAFAGRAAASLLAANQLFVTYGAGYMAHGPTIALVTAAAWLLIRTERLDGWRVRAGWAAAGLLLGCTVAIRPLTGAALMTSIALWQLARQTHGWRSQVRLTVFLALGSALPVLALLYFNDVTNGSPLAFGYAAAHGPLHDLGFGERGFVAPDLLGRPMTELVDFTVGRAFSNVFIVMSNLAPVVLPAFVFVPILVIGRQHGFSFRWATVCAFLVLPAVHFFYFYWHTRFYLELFPFIFVGLAGILAHVRRQNPVLARTLLAAVIAAELLATSLDVRRRTTEVENGARHAVITAMREAQKAGSKVLVFVEGHYSLLNWASWFNIDGFPGDVIAARDLGTENWRLQRRFPQHVPMRMTLSGNTARLTRLDPE